MTSIKTNLGEIIMNFIFSKEEMSSSFEEEVISSFEEEVISIRRNDGWKIVSKAKALENKIAAAEKAAKKAAEKAAKKAAEKAVWEGGSISRAQAWENRQIKRRRATIIALQGELEEATSVASLTEEGGIIPMEALASMRIIPRKLRGLRASLRKFQAMVAWKRDLERKGVELIKVWSC